MIHSFFSSDLQCCNQGLNNSSRNPDPTSTSCKLRMRQASHCKKEEKLRKILKCVLMSSLYTVEHTTVFAVHLWIFHTILLSCHSNPDPFPHDHEDGSNASRYNISIVSW